MSVLVALILGIIQGLTEFLPVSSSGHLLLVENIFGISEGSLFFNVLVHFATLIAVVLVFWKDVVYLVRHPFSKEMGTIIVACIPTVIIALLFEHFADEFAMSSFVGFGFLVSGVIVGLTSILQRRKNAICTPIDYKKALAIGFVQGLAVLPGISRSGSTICAGLMMKTEREEAGKFSVLISIPVICGGMIFEIIDGCRFGFGKALALPSIVGFLSAFVVALLTIKLMMKVIKSGNWWPFAVYLVLLSIFTLLNQYVFMWF